MTPGMVSHKLGKLLTRLDVRAGGDLGHYACRAAGDFANEFDAGGDGMRVFADIGCRRVEIVEIDDRAIARIMRGKPHRAGAVLRMTLRSEERRVGKEGRSRGAP